MIELKNVSAQTTDKVKILENINVEFKKNSMILVLGPNAAGKTTFAQIIAGNSDVKISGEIFFKNENITKTKLVQRAKMGIFASYQNPIEIPGLKIFEFLFHAYKAVVKNDICVWDFHAIVLENLKKLKLEPKFLERNVNEGFSGGEKKKFEILQMLLLQPKVILLDEIDSGLDIDSVKDIFKVLENYKKETKSTIVIISHSPKILQYIKPDEVILIQGKTIKEKGDIKLAKKILKNGYE